MQSSGLTFLPNGIIESLLGSLASDFLISAVSLSNYQEHLLLVLLAPPDNTQSPGDTLYIPDAHT